MTKMPSETDPPRPPLPWARKLFVSAVSLVLDASIRRDGSVNRRLLSLFDLHARPDPKPAGGVATSDHTVDPTRNLKIRLFSPSVSAGDQGSSPLPVVVYFHGGGFAFHSAFTGAYDALCRRLSRQIPALVVSVDYRLAPEHRHPAAYDDGLDVLRWLDSGDLIPDLSAVFLAGDSAGGNIAHHVARRAATMTSSFKKLYVAGLVAVQPFFGGEEDTESEKILEGVPFGSRERFKWMWRSFLPVGSGLDHESANVFGPGSDSGSGLDWVGFPKTMVVIGGFDTLQDRQRWYCEGLKRVGVDVCVKEYRNAVHGFYAFSELPEAGEFMADVAEFVKEVSSDVKVKKEANLED